MPSIVKTAIVTTVTIIGALYFAYTWWASGSDDEEKDEEDQVMTKNRQSISRGLGSTSSSVVGTGSSASSPQPIYRDTFDLNQSSPDVRREKSAGQGLLDDQNMSSSDVRREKSAGQGILDDQDMSSSDVRREKSAGQGLLDDQNMSSSDVRREKSAGQGILDDQDMSSSDVRREKSAGRGLLDQDMSSSATSEGSPERISLPQSLWQGTFPIKRELSSSGLRGTRIVAAPSLISHQRTYSVQPSLPGTEEFPAPSLPREEEEPAEDDLAFDECYDMTAEELGSGSFGSVSLAFAKSDGELRVVKTIPREKVSRWEDGWPIELKLQSTCHSHPNITPILEAFRDEDGFRFIMPFNPGAENLHKWRYQRLGLLDNKIVFMSLIRQMVDAVHHMHQQDIAHSDLKPLNMLVFRDDKEPGGYRLQVLDFGESILFQRGQRTFRFVAATPPYIGPEYDWESPDVEGPEVDVFSLGVILFELIYGYLPFDDRDEINDMDIEVNLPEWAPTSCGGWMRVPAQLEYLMVGMMMKNPRDRLTIDEIRQWLESC